jgi:hypothetical protein
MDNLEKYITENRELFDDALPPEGHFSRFESKLDQQNVLPGRSFDRFFLLKIAAGLLILLTVSVYIFDFAADHLSKSLTGENKAAVVSTEIQDAINYYDDAASTKLGQINKLACCGQDTRNIYKMASTELRSLNANSEELKKMMAKDPDERIQAAIIENQKMKEKVMSDLVTQMKRR